jgi:type VI protein secretion system component Hcp
MKKLGFAICLLLLFSVRSFAQDVPANAKQTKSTIVVQVNGLNCSTAMGQGTFNAVKWSFGATDTTTVTGSGGGAGKAMVGTLNVEKRWDECSPELFLGTVSGKTFKR